MKKNNYSSSAEFWRKNKPRVMGDIIGRPRVIDLLGDIRGKKILESGAGAGYLARALAQKGALVFGCEREKKMLEVAVDFEKKEPLGIKYDLADITKTPYESNFFDGVSSVSVLIHNDTKAIELFFREAHRILKKGGILVVSVSHPFLFTLFSPTRMKNKCWLKHESLEDKPYNESQKFKEFYYDIEGNVFMSEVWHHTISTYIGVALETKLKITKIQELIIEKNHLLTPLWGKEYGYPAFFQIKAMKS